MKGSKTVKYKGLRDNVRAIRDTRAKLSAISGIKSDTLALHDG